MQQEGKYFFQKGVVHIVPVLRPDIITNTDSTWQEKKIIRPAGYGYQPKYTSTGRRHLCRTIFKKRLKIIRQKWSEVAAWALDKVLRQIPLISRHKVEERWMCLLSRDSWLRWSNSWLGDRKPRAAPAEAALSGVRQEWLQPGPERLFGFNPDLILVVHF